MKLLIKVLELASIMIVCYGTRKITLILNKLYLNSEAYYLNSNFD